MEKTGNITRELLKIRSGEFDIESIHSLDLKREELGDLGCIGECSGLERLDLSYNDVTRLHSLASLTSLVSLNLSANRISCLEGLQTLDNLMCLNLSGNLIGSTDALNCLSGLEKLEDLRLQNPVTKLSNPVCMGTGYKAQVVNKFPEIKVLDGERLTGKGSEIFKICDDIEKVLKVRSESAGGDVNITPESWFTDDYWSSTSNESVLGKSYLEDAEADLINLLKQCEKINEEADDKLKQASLDLHQS